MDWDKPMALVRQRGNRLDRLQLRRAPGEPCTQVEAEQVLGVYQFPDESWDYDAPQEKSDYGALKTCFAVTPVGETHWQ